MKKIIALLLTIIIIGTLNLEVTDAKSIYTKDDNCEIYSKQIEAKNMLLLKALDNFGARTKEEALNIYCEGIKTRSGALQYSVMNSKLKKEFIKTMDKEKNYSWVTGFSSPWVKDYEVIYNKENIDKSYTVTVKFNWETSSGPFNNTETNLTIKEEDGYWRIVSIENEYE